MTNTVIKNCLASTRRGNDMKIWLLLQISVTITIGYSANTQTVGSRLYNNCKFHNNTNFQKACLLYFYVFKMLYLYQIIWYYLGIWSKYLNSKYVHFYIYHYLTDDSQLYVPEDDYTTLHTVRFMKYLTELCMNV